MENMLTPSLGEDIKSYDSLLIKYWNIKLTVINMLYVT